MPIQFQIDAHGLTQFCRTVRQIDVLATADGCASATSIRKPPFPHDFDAPHRFNGTNQRSRAEAVIPRTDIETAMHAIGDIDVCASGRAEQRRIAFASAVKGVTCRIVLIVGLRLHDAGGRNTAIIEFTDQQTAKQSNGRLIGRTGQYVIREIP